MAYSGGGGAGAGDSGGTVSTAASVSTAGSVSEVIPHATEEQLQRRIHGHWTGRFYMLRGAGELHAFAGKDAMSLAAPISTLSVGSATVLSGPGVKEAAQADGLFLDERCVLSFNINI